MLKKAPGSFSPSCALRWRLCCDTIEKMQRGVKQMKAKRSGAISERSRTIYISVAVVMSMVCIAVFSYILALGQGRGESIYLKLLVAELGMLFATILYICCCFNITEDTWQGHTFTAVSALLFVNIFLSGVCDALSETPGAGQKIVLMQTATNIISAWIHILFWIYQCDALPKNRARRYYSALIYGGAALYLLLVILNLFTGNLYYADAEGKVIYSGETTEILIAAAFYLTYLLYILPQPFPWKKKLSIASFAVFPLFSIVLSFLWYSFGIIYSMLSVTYIFLLLAAYVVFFGDYVESKELLLRQKTELTELQAALMLSQIRPHFLYNALTAIRNLCKHDPEKAYEALGSFSDYLRGNMEALGSGRIIPFEKELEHIETYLMLEQMRYGDDLTVEYDIRYRDFSLPALTVQPIVENAVRHGALMNESGGLVTIRTEKRSGSACITVSDNGPGFDPARLPDDGRSHFGLVNVKNCLAAGEYGELHIESSPACGTTATILIREGEE